MINGGWASIANLNQIVLLFPQVQIGCWEWEGEISGTDFGTNQAI